MLIVLQVVETLPHPAHPGPAQLEQHRVDGQLPQLDNYIRRTLESDGGPITRSWMIENERERSIHAFVSTFECWIKLCWI